MRKKYMSTQKKKKTNKHVQMLSNRERQNQSKKKVEMQHEGHFWQLISFNFLRNLER